LSAEERLNEHLVQFITGRLTEVCSTRLLLLLYLHHLIALTMITKPDPSSFFSCPSALIANVSSVGGLAAGGWHLKRDGEMGSEWDGRQGDDELMLDTVLLIIPVSADSTRLTSPITR
jgi:hypothetical protein